MVFLFLALTLQMGSTKPSEPSEFQRYYSSAVAHLEKLDYERALLQATKAAVKAERVADESRADLLRGVVQAESGNFAAAREAFSSGFMLQADAKLPTVVSPKISALAEKARSVAKRTLALSRETSRPNSSADERPAASKVCGTPMQLPQTVWNSEREEAIAVRLRRSQVPEIAASADSMVTRLNNWAWAWADQQLAICLRENVLKRLPPGAARARRKCLESQTETFNELIKSLLSDESLSAEAINVTKNLPQPSDCVQTQIVEPRPGTSDELEAQQLTNRVIALVDTGQIQELEKQMPRLMALSQTSSDANLRAKALYLDALLKRETGKLRESEAALKECVPKFLESGSPREAIWALNALLFVQSDGLNDFVSAKANYEWATRLIQRQEDRKVLQARIDIRWAGASMYKSQLRRSLSLLESSVRVLETSARLPTPNNELWAALNNLGGILDQLDREEESLPVYERAAASLIQEFGPNHNNLVPIWANLARVQMYGGDLKKAKATIELAVALADKLHWQKGQAWAYSVMAQIQMLEGHGDVALQYYQPVVAWYEATLPPGHPRFFHTWYFYGILLRMNQQVTKAINYHQKAFELAVQQADKKREAGINIELGLDYADAQDWERVSKHLDACLRHLRQNRLTDAEKLWCRVLEARRAEGRAEKPLARQIAQNVVDKRMTMKGSSLNESNRAKSEAQALLQRL